MLIDLPSIAPEEALNGYLLRLAELNGLGGVQQLLEPLAIKPRASYSPEQVGRIANLLGVDRSPLVQANLVASRMARPDVNAQFAPASRLPVCPLCFAEEPVIRRSWLNIMTPVCTRHGVRLVDRCGECGEPFTWRRASLSMCMCGVGVAEAAAAPAPAFSHALSCAIHGVSVPAGLSQLLPAAFVAPGQEQRDHLAWLLACHGADPGGAKVMKRPRPVDTDEAIALLEESLQPIFSKWPEGMQQLLTRIDVASPSQSSGIGKQLGNWYRVLHRNFGQDRFQWLHDEVAQFVASHMVLTINDRVTRIPKCFGQIKGWLSVAEAARAIGIAPERLRHALRAGEVEGEARRGGADRDFCFLRRHVVEEIRARRARYVDARRAMALLDVTKRQLKRLVDAGGVTHREPADRPSLVDAPFLEEELHELMQCIESRLQPWPSPRHGAAITLSDITAVRGRGEDYVLRAYRAILRGDVVPRALQEGAVGLNRLVFDEDELNVVALPNPHDARMTMTQLCDMMGWKHEAVAKWVENGHLKAERIANGPTMTTLFRVDDLLHFATRHVILSVMAAECGARSKDLAELLEDHGCQVHSFHHELRGGRFASIVALEELGALLQEVCRAEVLR